MDFAEVAEYKTCLASIKGLHVFTVEYAVYFAIRFLIIVPLCDHSVFFFGECFLLCHDFPLVVRFFLMIILYH